MKLVYHYYWSEVAFNLIDLICVAFTKLQQVIVYKMTRMINDWGQGSNAKYMSADYLCGGGSTGQAGLPHIAMYMNGKHTFIFSFLVCYAEFHA